MFFFCFSERRFEWWILGSWFTIFRFLVVTGLDVPGWPPRDEDDVERFWTVSLNYHHFWIFRVLAYFLCVVCWMSGFSGPWCCKMFLFLFGSRLSTSDVGLRWLKRKHAPETWLDWRNYKDSPLKGQIPTTRSGQTVKTVFLCFPCWRLGHVGNWPSTCWTLPGNGGWRVKVGIGWWIAKLLWGDEFVETWKMFVLGGGFNSNIFYFQPDPWGKMIQFDYCNIFQMGWFNHQPVLRWSNLESFQNESLI